MTSHSQRALLPGNGDADNCPSGDGRNLPTIQVKGSFRQMRIQTSFAPMASIAFWRLMVGSRSWAASGVRVAVMGGAPFSLPVPVVGPGAGCSLLVTIQVPVARGRVGGSAARR